MHAKEVQHQPPNHACSSCLCIGTRNISKAEHRAAAGMNNHMPLLPAKVQPPPQNCHSRTAPVAAAAAAASPVPAGHHLLAPRELELGTAQSLSGLRERTQQHSEKAGGRYGDETSHQPQRASAAAEVMPKRACPRVLHCTCPAQHGRKPLHAS
jgi:hypothetical protein